MVETGRRKVVVFAQLENQGENAYGTTVHISTSSNLLFSGLTVKVRNHLEKSQRSIHQNKTDKIRSNTCIA